MFQDFIKQTAVSMLNAQGKKLRNKDADNKGADDAGGRALEIFATTIETIDFNKISDAKSLRNIGKTLEAIGKRLQQEADAAG